MTLRQPPYGIGATSSGKIRQMNICKIKPSPVDGFSFYYFTARFFVFSYFIIIAFTYATRRD
ncbi:hypothetical protein AB840_00890 [Megasphaera cerevisiae DSM 20462]|jgi:hypothetical protein|uniref:Uncharacterized protein n=1 Tax=Megasphaera cerevisiae DSM 20462 TaxID=1122219 RepID=A0A0J6WZN1_9FIRM|nr:hypothetical protein AB840_00890 [Megasphaera cerevisiae DSM 20462]